MSDQRTTDIVARKGGVMTDEVGAVTGDLTLRTELADDGSVRQLVQYVGADEWYEVSILNNREDPGFAAGTDDDGTVILRAVGHGPDQTIVAVEAEVQDPLCLSTIFVLSFRSI